MLDDALLKMETDAANTDQWYTELENPEEFYSDAAKYWEVRIECDVM